MKVFRYAPLLLCSLLATGCTSDKDICPGCDPFYYRSFIEEYIESTGWAIGNLAPDGEILPVKIDGRRINQDHPDYRALSERYSDTGWNRYNLPGLRISLCDDFSYMDIVAIEDFSGSYPAGSSLSDIVVYSGSTSWPYIKSGYDEELPYQPVPNEGLAPKCAYDRYIPVIKYVYDLTPEDLYLAAPLFYLRFTVLPENRECEIEIVLGNYTKELRQRFILQTK